MKVLKNNYDRTDIVICTNCHSVIELDVNEDLFEAYRGADFYQWVCPCCECSQNYDKKVN